MVPLENAEMVRLSAISLNKKVSHWWIGKRQKTRTQDDTTTICEICSKSTIKIKLNLRNLLLLV